MSKQKCADCGKLFQQNDSSQITSLGCTLGRDPDKQLCYNCALQKVSGGNPEEGDFNTAHLISGEITDQEWKRMQEDFRAVETGHSSCEPDYCQEYEDDYDDTGTNCS